MQHPIDPPTHHNHHNGPEHVDADVYPLLGCRCEVTVFVELVFFVIFVNLVLQVLLIFVEEFDHEWFGVFLDEDGDIVGDVDGLGDERHCFVFKSDEAGDYPGD